MGIPFHVDQRVLIPRSPLAELIEQGLTPWYQGPSVNRVLDLCTGSGCIGIGAALVFEEAEVDLADISPDALAVAKSNIARYDLAERVTAVQSDLFDQIEGPYDAILTNPPYVDQQDLDSMPPEYHHEPRLGLEAGQDGLEIAHRILAEAADYLSPEGVLICEVGNSWVALEQAYPDVPFTWIEFEHGGHGVFVFSREELVQYF